MKQFQWIDFRAEGSCSNSMMAVEHTEYVENTNL